MSYEQKDNSGSLFVNDRKQQDNHPDRQGTIMVEGKLYWINGWLRKTNDGKPWLSLSVKPKEEAAPRQQAKKPAQRPAQDDFDSDIPF